MLSKRSRGDDSASLPPRQRFRHNLADLFLSNQVSAARATALAADAVAAGASGVSDLANIGDAKHRHRNLLRKFMRRSKWPTTYDCLVRLKDLRSGETVTKPIPILLPHEIVHVLGVRNPDRARFLCRAGFDDLDLRQMRSIEAKTGEADGTLLGLAMWMDGIACKWDRSQSLDLIVLSFPGWTGKWSNVRIPIAAVEHRYVVKQHTMDDILDVVAWSLRAAFIGRFPDQRHDGEWQRTDVRRRRLTGPIGVRSALVRITGDWKAYKDIWRFPQFNEVRGICWLCSATPASYKDTTSTAQWRSERLDHWACLRRLQRNGLRPCPLMGLPYFDTALICRIDWLHAMDLGVAADFVGQLLVYLLPLAVGRTRREQLQDLWCHIDAGYMRHPTSSRIDALTESMLNLSGNAPKLKVHAAECRGLVPVATGMAVHFLSAANTEGQTVLHCARALSACYDALSHTAEGAQQAMASASRRFCTLYVALERTTPPFHVRPKLHMCQELLEMQPGTCPAKHWTYRDEDFGGSMAHLFRPRGGQRHEGTTGFQVLRKFCARHCVPAL